MKFSQSIQYAMHELSYLVKKTENKSVLIKDIAEAILVPEGYLRKVFQLLARNGLVRSQRGATGGFCLAKRPDEISFKNVVEAVDGSVPLFVGW